MSSAAKELEVAYSRSLPQPLTSICAFLALVGVIAFVVALATDPQVAWLAYHANFIYFLALSLGGLAFAAIMVVVSANWPGPLRRMFEALAAWVPISFVLACIGYFGGDYLFEWKREGAVHGKEVWLNTTRVYGTDLFILGVLALSTVWFLKVSNRPMLKGLADNLDGKATGFAQNMAKRWTANWKGDVEERDAAFALLSKRAAPLLFFYAFGFSFFIFDQVMSMEQTWFSTLFGAYVTWGGILSAVAAVALCCTFYKSAPGFEGLITEDRMHDIGKLMFAFSIFWMYLFWSQYLVIWYGNLPEETQFFMDRLGNQFVIDKGAVSAASWAKAWSSWDFDWTRLNNAYGWTAMTTWACLWIIPFWVLLSQVAKKTTWVLGPVAAIVLFGFWLERNLLIWPSVIKNDSTSYLGMYQILIALGFFGAYGFVFLVYTRVFPTIAVAKKD
ncbi:MAG: hypothetical protein IH881_14100 [Myxococcales bacterium]|nr:hypothetical protein [Myxococcales bacterium]